MMAVAFFFSYSYCFSWLNTVDPCLVANLFAPEKIAKLQQRRRRQDNESSASYYGEPLPKIIHQQWKTLQIPKGKYTEWRQAWLDLFPESEGYQHILWTDEAMRQLIVTQFPWFVNIYDGYQYNIQRADASRYFILHHFGGLYADLDYQPLVNFWNRIPRDMVSLIESPYKYNEYHQNSLMASPKGDIFWKQVFDALVQSSSSSSSLGTASVFAKTGPQFLDRVARQGGQPFYTLPCENFHRVPFVQNPGQESPWITRLGHHTLARFYPMKNCGDFSQPSCQYGKHHNAVSYLQETGGLM
jgi:mannosyltransferase OCH1-like enzyme